MYLFVTPAGKYWRLDYRYLGKRKTLALGVSPLFPFQSPHEACRALEQAWRTDQGFSYRLH
jgi:hypothetical protein